MAYTGPRAKSWHVYVTPGEERSIDRKTTYMLVLEDCASDAACKSALRHASLNLKPSGVYSVAVQANEDEPIEWFTVRMETSATPN